MDWEAFFRDHNIEYVTRGPNVKKGNVNISCPFCGEDPSHHMGVSLNGKGFGCWRSVTHAGKKPHNLIRALLNCSFNQAKIIAQQYSAADPESLDEALAALEGTMQPDKAPDKPRKLWFPRDFRPIKSTGSTARFYNYIYNRGFGKDTKDVIKLYGLMCATTGRWKNRIIIPIYMDGELVSWTSRIIVKSTDAPRYLALGEEPAQGSGDPAGLINVFHSLWNWDELQEGGDLLVVCEGPFDGLKVDFYAIELNSCATCTFGTAMSEEQAMLIAEVAKNFRKAVLLYDEGATEAIFLAKQLLEHTNVEVAFLPHDVEDPGDMTKKHVLNFIREHLK
jgi:hypothetical protein